MKTIYYKNKFFSLLLLSVLILFLFPLFACKKQVDYTQYISELRDNVFLAEKDTLSLCAYSVEKEYPYESDGIKRETSRRTEVRLVTPSGDKICTIDFSVDGKQYGGEMSYDNVKGEYYYVCSLNSSQLNQLIFDVNYGETYYQMTAKSVKTPTTFSAQQALQIVQTAESELFEGMTDKYGFAGEIYLRLIFEETPYYYVGIINRNGQITAFLLNAESGKILAKRQS